MQLFGAPRIKPPFEAQMATEGVASTLGLVNLGIVGKLGGDVRLSCGARGMRLQVRLPISSPYEGAP
jgi:hypothetical protein